MAKGDFGETGVKEPEAGYWWVLRSDNRRFIVLVHDYDGKKSVEMMGGGSKMGLSMYRRQFRFLVRIPEAEELQSQAIVT